MSLNRPRTAWLQLGVGLAIFWASAAQSAEPLAAIDWLIEPPTRQIANEDEESGALGAKSGFALPIAVTTGALTDYNINAAGLITAQTARLPSDLWPSTQIAHAARILPRVPKLKSKEANLLLAALLMAENDADRVFDTVPLFIARIEKLVDLGALEAAAALISLASEYNDDRLIRLALDIALIRGPAPRECTAAITADALGHEEDRLVEIYCHAVTKNWHEAELLLITSEALDLLSDVDLELMWQFMDPEYADTAPAPTLGIDQLTPIRFQLVASLGATPFLADAPTPYQWPYLNGRTGWKLQIEAAEKLAHAGVVSGNALLQHYTARKPSASGGVWDRAAAVQRLDAAIGGNRVDALHDAHAIFARTGDRLLLAEVAYALDLSRDARIARDPLWIELMLLAHPQTVDRAAIPSTQQPRLAFAVAVLAQNIQAAAPFQASDPLAAAIWHALSTPVLPQAATGPEIAQALIQLSNGENGDIYALNQSLRQLRAMGLSDHASRIAAQLTILDAR
ncbi:MAG: hypothetical protein ABF310_08785 [Paracoccaceae bacterium]